MARRLPPPRFLRCTFLGGLALLVLGAGGVGACRRAETAAAAPVIERLPLRVQMDWYPQAEHGGFYQAQARGFYAEAGLEVTILPGGPGARSAHRVVAGAADLAIHRSDDLLVQIGEGLPFVMLAAFMQHDPQALLLHASNPIDSFAELDGQRIMAMPGTNWVAYLQRRYNISFQVLPMNFGLVQFMTDPGFIQQCFITSEPFHVQRQGVAAKTLLIAESGFDPYRVIYTTQRLVRDQPEAVRRFVAASLRGWGDFIHGDPSPAYDLIAERNPEMSREQMIYSRNAMRQHQLVTGDAAAGARLGLMTMDRLQAQQDTLLELGILSTPVPVEQWARFDFLPDAEP